MEVFREALVGSEFVGGRRVEAFERAFADACDARGCVGVANGTDALTLALQALDVGPGDVVLVPAFSFFATAEAVSAVGAIPRFVDIEASTYTLDPEALARSDLSGVKAIIAVHLYGQPADMDPILAFARERGLKVVEDCAQAHIARYRGKAVGGLGDLGAFSFYPSKNLGALGDGGAVVGTKTPLLQRVRRLGDHGRLGHAEHVEVGRNSRLDAIQAGVLHVKLQHLHPWTKRRQQLAQCYQQHLGDVAAIALPLVVEHREHVYHAYTIRCDRRDELARALAAEGIGAAVYYPRPLHLQPAYAHLGHKPGDFPVAEGLSRSCLSLPIYPALADQNVARVCKVITAWAGLSAHPGG